jgi:hypothetical protein
LLLSSNQIVHFLLGFSSITRTAQRFALAAAGEKTVWEQYKLEARKMPLNRADSQPSAARFVSWRGLANTLAD